MPGQKRPFSVRFSGKLFLGLLALAYLVYLMVFGRSIYTSVFSPSNDIIDHQAGTSASQALQHWTASNMAHATSADQQFTNTSSSVQQANNDTTAGKPGKKEGQLPDKSNVSYPQSTIGKVFFTSGGYDYVCSGTALTSSNHNTFDTAGHCLYMSGNWSQNVIFCPLYDTGNTPYGCWAAKDLAVPSEWINAGPNDLHQDFGMGVVSPNSQGNLTDVVGGIGWAYNQPTNSKFYAYGYPAGYPFDGQTIKSCEGAGKNWIHAGGTVVSIPCDMTGGSSGGGWFIKIDGQWYLNGHNDFTSSIQRNHMFSPYYDDVWYSLYQKAENA